MPLLTNSFGSSPTRNLTGFSSHIVGVPLPCRKKAAMLVKKKNTPAIRKISPEYFQLPILIEL
jgi:hypothetical protein